MSVERRDNLKRTEFFGMTVSGAVIGFAPALSGRLSRVARANVIVLPHHSLFLADETRPHCMESKSDLAANGDETMVRNTWRMPISHRRQ